jgi:hypothetical protein
MLDPNHKLHTLLPIYPTKSRTLGIEPPDRTGTDFIILNVELNVIETVQLVYCIWS